MSIQIFLQGKILGVEQFLLGASNDLDGRSHWISLLSEVLPRALLAELGLSKILLGSSGGEQFLLVLPSENRPQADGFLKAAAAHIHELSNGAVKLLWTSTENLGDWSIVRKRLNDDMQARLATPAAGMESAYFEPFISDTTAGASRYFSEGLGRALREASTVGWSPETPGMVIVGEGKHSWPLSPDGAPFARHVALSEDGEQATLDVFASRAKGRPIWGVLRGDVDNAGVRFRRATTIEEHVQLSVMYKQFFAGELEVLCSMPEFWQKLTLLYSGGDDFAVYGAWDALLGLARELQRLFQRFAEENLKDFVGPEGKTITMGLALARGPKDSLAPVYEEAGRNLETAKSAGKDCIYALGRTLEWKQLAEAAEIRDTMARMITKFGVSSQLFEEIASFYHETVPLELARQTGRSKNVRVERPWRFHRRLNAVIPERRNKEFQKLRTDLISDFTGRRAAQIRLRPGGRVALEWAKLETERTLPPEWIEDPDAEETEAVTEE